ncbi:MAG: hypothetical protein CL678_07595 [Bdellovibrionaceae bacterium]|nr:hypothetical protein [Pseudobdellovibrionaceae bacterium]
MAPLVFSDSASNNETKMAAFAPHAPVGPSAPAAPGIIKEIVENDEHLELLISGKVVGNNAQRTFRNANINLNDWISYTEKVNYILKHNDIFDVRLEDALVDLLAPESTKMRYRIAGMIERMQIASLFSENISRFYFFSLRRHNYERELGEKYCNLLSCLGHKMENTSKPFLNPPKLLTPEEELALNSIKTFFNVEPSSPFTDGEILVHLCNLASNVTPEKLKAFMQKSEALNLRNEYLFVSFYSDDKQGNEVVESLIYLFGTDDFIELYTAQKIELSKIKKDLDTAMVACRFRMVTYDSCTQQIENCLQNLRQLQQDEGEAIDVSSSIAPPVVRRGGSAQERIANYPAIPTGLFDSTL